MTSSDFIHNPVFVVLAISLWLYCLGILTVPRLRSMDRSSMFWQSHTPMGRGVARATTMQALFLFAALSAALAANLPLPLVAEKVVGLVFLAIAVLSVLLGATLVFFNWPRVLAPQKRMRGQPGAIREWIDRARRR